MTMFPLTILLELGKTVGLFAAVGNLQLGSNQHLHRRRRENFGEIWIFYRLCVFLPYILTLIVLTLTSHRFFLQERAVL